MASGTSARARGSFTRRLLITIGLAFAPLIVVLAVFAVYIYAGIRAGGDVPQGTIGGLGVRAAASIVRDERGIPHIRAQNEHDAFFLEGYAQGTDRLFQMDAYRRLVAGRLAEVFGSAVLANDEAARIYDIDGIANAQLAHMSPRGRDALQAFSDGVNAAIKTRPLPPEFRILGYSPQPWTPKDSLIASFATVLALTDDWNAVASRIAVDAQVGPAARDAFYSISDPKFDAPTTGGPPAPVAPLPALRVAYPLATPAVSLRGDLRAGLGSNDAVSGAQFTATHRALLENDPHLELRMPGVWWLVEIDTPTLHVAGVTLAGVPGVVLGHNAHLAWGATNGTVATVRVYREHFQSATSDRYLADGRYVQAQHRSETFGARFGKPATLDFLRTRHGFVFTSGGIMRYAAAWTADFDRRSSLDEFDGLARATNVADAQRLMRAYPGPAQNFVLADDRGNAGYVLAGEVPLDDAWGLRAHDGPTSPAPPPAYVPYDRMPHVAAARNAVAFTANDRTYAKGYPYRLTAAFAPPYRAWSLARHLAKRPYDIAGFSAMQSDVFSPPEAELAFVAEAAFLRKKVLDDPQMRDAIEALRTFDGTFTPDSRGAVFVTMLRRAAVKRLAGYHMSPDVEADYLDNDAGAGFVALLRALRDRPRGWVPGDDYDEFLVDSMRDGMAALHAQGAYDETWADFGARVAQHPLAGWGFAMWNGVRFPGLGDAYSLHVQAPANAQSFRAVWDVGNWQAGGIVIPQGESGEPGSPHYRDAAERWLAGGLVPLPFGQDAVRAAAHETLNAVP